MPAPDEQKWEKCHCCTRVCSWGVSHAWACHQHMCDSAVKRSIFSKFLKAFNYFTCTQGKNKVRDLFQHWETLAIPDTWRETTAAPYGASLSLRKADVDPTRFLSYESPQYQMLTWDVTPLRLNGKVGVPTMQCAEIWSNMYGFLRKKPAPGPAWSGSQTKTEFLKLLKIQVSPPS